MISQAAPAARSSATELKKNMGLKDRAGMNKEEGWSGSDGHLQRKLAIHRHCSRGFWKVRPFWKDHFSVN